MRSLYYLVLILLALFLFSTSGMSLAKNNALTIESYGVTQGSLSGDYERKLTNKISLAVQFLTSKGSRQDFEYTGIGGGTGIKYYLSQQALNGTYIGASGNVVSIKFLSDLEEGKITSFGLAGSLGYKWILERGMAIDVGFSLAIPISTQITTSESGLRETVSFGKIGSGINLGLGFAW